MIKKFLEYYNGDLGYQVIGTEEFIEMNYIKTDNFTQREVDMIKSKFSGAELRGNPPCFMSIKIGSREIGIVKFVDEWFSVNYNHQNYYKCDQFEGLVQ